MATASGARYATGHSAEERSSRLAAVAKTGLLAGALGGMMMGTWQMVVGLLADEPTAVERIETSFWTPMTAIPSVLFGLDWFHEDFDLWPVVLGLAGHMMNAMVLGVIGVAVIAAIAGRPPSRVAALMTGVAYGLVLELVMIHLIVNPIQEPNALYTSTPQWSWWAAHVIYGMALALGSIVLLGRMSKRGSAR